MNKTIGITSASLVVMALVSLFTCPAANADPGQASVQSLKRESPNPASIVGVWELKSSNSKDETVGVRITIRQVGDSFEVDGRGDDTEFQGSERGIGRERVPGFTDLSSDAVGYIPVQVLSEAVGKIHLHDTATLSEDGQTIEYVQETWNVSWMNGHLSSVRINPRSIVTTFIRVPAANPDAHASL